MAVSNIQSSLQALNTICSLPFQFARIDLCQTTTCKFSHRRWWFKKPAGEFIISSISTECLECYHVFATIFHRAAWGLFFFTGGSKWVLPIIIPIKSNKDLTISHPIFPQTDVRATPPVLKHPTKNISWLRPKRPKSSASCVASFCAAGPAALLTSVKSLISLHLWYGSQKKGGTPQIWWIRT